MQEALVKQSPENVEWRADLGWTLQGLGRNLVARQQPREAKEVLQEAVASSKLLLERAPRVTMHRRLLHNHYGLLAEIEWRQGNAEASVSWALRKKALWPGNGWELYRAAAEVSRAAALLGEEEEMPPARRKQYNRYIEQSLAALREAVQAGFADAAALSKDPDLKPLRGREAFEKLLRMMPAPGRVGQ